MTLTRHHPTHRPAWRRHSPTALRISTVWAEVASVAEMAAPATRQRQTLEEAAQLVARALAEQLSDDNR